MMQAITPERGFWQRWRARIERALEWLALYPPYPFEAEYYFPPIEDRTERRGKAASDGH
jgi:hypothetical protein